MLAIANSIIPAEARQTLLHLANYVPFATSGITFAPLSGHIDVFVYCAQDILVLAPNIPQSYVDLFVMEGVNYCFGTTTVGKDNDSVVAYNVASNNRMAVHNFKKTDPLVADIIQDLQHVDCKQAFTRCSTLLLTDAAITSDRGIAKQLQNTGMDVLYVLPDDIVLPGYRCGCFGGCCGVMENKVVVCGSMDFHTQGNEIRNFIIKHEFQIIELAHLPLLDVGSIFFVETER